VQQPAQAELVAMVVTAAQVELALLAQAQPEAMQLLELQAA
jgi:hypothetical protein